MTDSLIHSGYQPTLYRLTSIAHSLDSIREGWYTWGKEKPLFHRISFMVICSR
jgi:hypothetical protein